MTKAQKLDLALTLPSVAIYVLVAWVIARVVNHTFPVWAAFVALVAVRGFFGVLSMIADAVAWRVYLRGYEVDRLVEFFRAMRFPPRQYHNQSFEAYLSYLTHDRTVSPDVQVAVAQVNTSLSDADIMGYFKGRRMIAAGEAALDIYSPRALAPDRPDPRTKTQS